MSRRPDETKDFEQHRILKSWRLVTTVPGQRLSLQVNATQFRMTIRKE
jgi:hypothetical protein